MSATQAAGEFDVEGRRLRITSLDRVIFPQTGTTKADLLAYYIGIAPALLPHLRDRLLHMHRYPEGVTGPRFWQKQCPEHRPEWLPTAPVWSRQKRANIDYCVANELAAVLWAVNIGSLELHTSLHTRHDMQRPTTLAFDLDPGEGAGLLECCEVALRVRDVLGQLGLRSFAKTSGSKGLQIYAPLNTDVSYREAKPFARALAELLEHERGDLVVAEMAKARRAGKVLVDWSQNTEHKSTVAPYSVRAKTRPTVSTPVSWDEIEAALEAGDAGGLVFEMPDVLARFERDGDVFAEVLTMSQRLPAAPGLL
jgi:bifunctional non-homologous end joining protein LigD